MGVLTQFLLKRDDIDFRVVEIDKESVEYLQCHYPQLAPRILSADFLKLNLAEMYSEKVSIIGNFPYNISSQILFKILENKDLVTETVGMFQKEVAERMASKPGCKAYGILSVLMQAFYDIEYLFTVHEHVFNPPPKVKSAVIRMTRNDVQDLGCDEKLFKRIVKTTFNQRRKTLRNNIKPLLGELNALRQKQGLPALDPTPFLTDKIFDKRPEQLSVEEFVLLTKKTTEFFLS